MAVLTGCVPTLKVKYQTKGSSLLKKKYCFEGKIIVEKIRT